MLRAVSALLRRMPNHAAVAGGWVPLLGTAWTVLRHEGFGSFYRKLSRLSGGAEPQGRTQMPLCMPVDVKRFNGTEALTIARSLKFRQEAKPRVSIVIPVYNHLEFTLECLAAIERNPQQASFEIIIVDDASTDETAVTLPSVPGVRYYRNERNVGYLLSCNRASELVRGEFVLFLNNDTQVQTAWLDPLVSRLDADPKIGVVGPMLLFPDGRLQEAGARLAGDGDLAGELIGLGDSPFDPCYQFAREVEYCSGASLIVRRSLLEDVGGLDSSFAPAYFEDVDLAYKVRRAGYRVYYEPRSVVVHHLSVSTGSIGASKRELVSRNSRTFMEKWHSERSRNRAVRFIAFFLPQYHPIPENDEWWGKGFTEWTNVTKARPNFADHHQPQLPGELGFYDLRLAETREAQADLAAAYGLSGFCFYYYWFNGKRLLNRPLDEIVSLGEPDFPFCICWANENWTRTWDGRENHVLIAQSHSMDDDRAFIRALLPTLRDKRYICVDGRPMILVYKVALLPDALATAAVWRQECRDAGLGEIYLVCVHNDASPDRNPDPGQIGFDAALEFPPSGKGVLAQAPSDMRNQDFRGVFYDYEKTAENLMQTDCPPFTFFRGVMPSWDNTARRQDSSHIFLGSSPAGYARWLQSAAEWTARMHVGDERIVFVNAWNEWAEGNHLEPDQHYGRAYLEATQRITCRFQ